MTHILHIVSALESGAMDANSILQQSAAQGQAKDCHTV